MMSVESFRPAENYSCPRFHFLQKAMTASQGEFSRHNRYVIGLTGPRTNRLAMPNYNVKAPIFSPL
jgi:hypothetical protein